MHAGVVLHLAPSGSFNKLEMAVSEDSSEETLLVCMQVLFCTLPPVGLLTNLKWLFQRTPVKKVCYNRPCWCLWSNPSDVDCVVILAWKTFACCFWLKDFAKCFVWHEDSERAWCVQAVHTYRWWHPKSPVTDSFKAFVDLLSDLAQPTESLQGPVAWASVLWIFFRVCMPNY